MKKGRTRRRHRSMDRPPLVGWKGVRAYLAERWEVVVVPKTLLNWRDNRGLPARRVPPSREIFVDRDLLDAWVLRELLGKDPSTT